MPGGVAKADTEIAVDGKPAGKTGLAEAAITFNPDNENGEPAQLDLLLTGEGDVDGETLLPLEILTGETKADEQVLKTTTIGQLPKLETADQAEPSAVTAEMPEEITVQNVTTPIPSPQAEAGPETSTDAPIAVETPALTTVRELKQAEMPAQSNPVAATTGLSELTAGDIAPGEITEIAQQLSAGQQVKPAAGAEKMPPIPVLNETRQTTLNGVPDQAAAATAAATKLVQDAAEGEIQPVDLMPGTETKASAVKAAVQAALADGQRGQNIAQAAQQAQPHRTDTQAVSAPQPDVTIATAQDSNGETPDDFLTIDTIMEEMQVKFETSPQASTAILHSAEAQVSSSAPQPGVVTVQAGEMRETVATTTSTNSAAAPARNLHMVDPDWPANLSTMIRAAQELGQNEIEIALQPERLGKMTIKMDLRDNNVAVNIVTETDAAARMLNDNQHRLADMMQKAGLDLAQHQANSGQNFQGQTGQGDQMAQNSQGGTAPRQVQPDDDISAHPVQTSPEKGIDIIA
ncbi:MAG: flagellar hook-length control protein FliK [Thalassovita sp.]|nr:flagellar hook-length control protein FliK [Thalassovita sp.]